jgi:hypothetical protein
MPGQNIGRAIASLLTKRKQTKALRDIAQADILFKYAGTQGLILTKDQLVVDSPTSEKRILAGNIRSVSMSRPLPWFFQRNLKIVYDDYPRSAAPQSLNVEINVKAGLRFINALEGLAAPTTLRVARSGKLDWLRIIAGAVFFMLVSGFLGSLRTGADTAFGWAIFGLVLMAGMELLSRIDPKDR